MAVAIDAVQAGTGADNVASFSYTHTPVGTPSAVGVAYCGYAGSGSSRTVTATYGGNNCPSEVVTAGVPTSTGATPTILGLGSPPSGAQTVEVACSGGGMYGIPYSVTVTGSDTSDVFSNSSASTGLSTAASTTCTTASDEIVLCAATFGFNVGTITIGADQTSRASFNPVTVAGARGSTQNGSDGGVMSYAMQNSAQWDIVAASFKAAGGGGGTLRGPFFTGNLSGLGSGGLTFQDRLG